MLINIILTMIIILKLYSLINFYINILFIKKNEKKKLNVNLNQISGENCFFDNFLRNSFVKVSKISDNKNSTINYEIGDSLKNIEKVIIFNYVLLIITKKVKSIVYSSNKLDLNSNFEQNSKENQILILKQQILKFKFKNIVFFFHNIKPHFF